MSSTGSSSSSGGGGGSTNSAEFSPIFLDGRRTDDRWIEYGWIRTSVGMRTPAGRERSVGMYVLCSRSDVNPNLFEPWRSVDEYTEIIPNEWIDKRLSQSDVEVMDESRALRRGEMKAWMIQPKNNSETVQFAGKKWHSAIALRNTIGVQGGLRAYHVLYEKTGNVTYVPFLHGPLAVRGLKVTNDDGVAGASIRAFQTVINRMIKESPKTMGPYLQTAANIPIEQHVVEAIAANLHNLSDKYLPRSYIDISRDGIGGPPQAVLMKEYAKNISVFDMIYEMTESLWMDRGNRIHSGHRDASRMYNTIKNVVDNAPTPAPRTDQAPDNNNSSNTGNNSDDANETEEV